MFLPLLTRSRSRSSHRTTLEGGRPSTSSCLSFRKPPSLSGSGRDSPNRIREQRIYDPTNLGIGDDEFAADEDVDRGIGKELLAKIEGYYERVKVVKFGHCFGLLDPVSNILVGDAIALSEKSLHKAELEEKEEKKKKEGKEKEMDEEEKQKEKQEEEEQQEEDAWLRANQPSESIAQRSLDGLVAFLVALFPCLTVSRAMWYLNKAELDPLVAARLIINHRGMKRTFGFQSDTTVAAVEMALRCAAAAAQHPNPRQFAIGWKLMSPSLRKVATLLEPSSAAQDSSRRMKISRSLLCPESLPPALVLEQSWDLASDRHRRNLKLYPEMLQQVPLRPTLRRMLLTTIHGHYLQALAWLPKDKLRSHEYHHSLLEAGHSYGPLDPTSNIIINTLWYAQLYPLTLKKKLEIKAISTNALLRIEVRSLYGLISYLCTCYPALTPGEAMLRLQLAGANLQKAADDLTSHRDGSGVEEAYTAAAKAAHHPKPLEQAQFLGSSNSKLPAFLQVLTCQEPRKARTLLLEYLPAVVARSKPEEPTKNINVLGPWDYSYVMRTINDFWYEHTRAVGMVECAIEMYSKQHGVPTYELHAICGVNEFVGGPLRSRTYSCSHINFLATKTTVGALPELFFAECRNKDGLGFCCPVAMPLPGTEQVRCPYCELTGSRIVHPTKESFRGRDREFEKMLFRDGVAHTATDIISGSRKETYWVDFLEEDRIYGDYICDNNIDVEKFPRDAIC